MPRYSYEEKVHAQRETAWRILLDAAENPAVYLGGVVESNKIQQRFDDGFIREVQARGTVVKERVFVDEEDGIIRYHLLDHPLVSEGEITVRAVPTSVQSPVAPLVLVLSVQLTPKVEYEKKVAELDLPALVRREVQSLKQKAEELERSS